jgi:hypothetical protein
MTYHHDLLRQTGMPGATQLGEHMDDCEIIAAIAAGDPAGLSAVYGKYAAGLYGYCRWMLLEPVLAADALLRRLWPPQPSWAA